MTYTDSDNTGCPIVPMMTDTSTEHEPADRRESLEELVWSHRTERPLGGRR
jgi:hypothetical protein